MAATFKVVRSTGRLKLGWGFDFLRGVISRKRAEIELIRNIWLSICAEVGDLE